MFLFYEYSRKWIYLKEYIVQVNSGLKEALQHVLQSGSSQKSLKEKKSLL